MTVERFEHHQLTKALVPDKHRDQYLHDAAFHASIERLALILPIWVDVLAQQPTPCPAFTIDLDPGGATKTWAVLGRTERVPRPADAGGIGGPHGVEGGGR